MVTAAVSPASGGRVVQAEKVRRIFERFDLSRDGGLNRAEMAALVAAVNPRVKFTDEQIGAILDEVFCTYADFILPDGRGLTLDGLLRTYEDGAGDANRDFDVLDLRLPAEDDIGSGDASAVAAGAPSTPVAAAGIIGDRLFSPAFVQKISPRPATGVPWSSSPNHGVVFASSWALVGDLEILVKRLRAKKHQMASGAGDDGDSKNNNAGSFSTAGWSREVSSNACQRRFYCDETSRDYLHFVKEVTILRGRADGARTREEVFDNHMALGRGLYEHRFFRESLLSFRRACELRPADVRSHFRIGNALYALGRHGEAKEEFQLALEAAEAGGSYSVDILPQIHVNLGITMEAEGMILGACEHYREASILCPTHFRALKLLGSALLGLGEFRAAEKALEEAIFLQPDFADAHCDLGSALHAMEDDERAIREFQKAINLEPDHVDALYNLGGLFIDAGRFTRASEMYGRVLSVQPCHWRAQLNKAVALLGAGESEEATKAFNEALKMTQRVEVYDAIAHLKALEKKKKNKPKGNGSTGEGAFIVVELSKFKRVCRKTTLRQDLVSALDIRAFQKVTRLSYCNVELLNKEMNEADVHIAFYDSDEPGKSVRKASLEVILRRLLRFIKPEAFQGAVKAINEKILSILDATGSGRVDLGMFFAVIAPMCSGHPETRKRIVFDALLWRSNKEGGSNIRRKDATRYIRLLRAIFIPSHGVDDMLEVHGESDPSMVPYTEFLEMLDDAEWGFGILDTILKLEVGDRVRHGRHTCSICGYTIIGSRFKETKCRFSLCNHCYSEGKVPSAFKQEEYEFKEYGSEAEAMKDKCIWFNLDSMCSKDDS